MTHEGWYAIKQWNQLPKIKEKSNKNRKKVWERQRDQIQRERERGGERDGEAERL